MNCWKLPFVWLWLCVIAFILPANASAAELPDGSYIVDAWGMEDGLPQSSVISVIQTRDGYLWLGTLNGLGARARCAGLRPPVRPAPW